MPMVGSVLLFSLIGTPVLYGVLAEGEGIYQEDNSYKHLRDHLYTCVHGKVRNCSCVTREDPKSLYFINGILRLIYYISV